MNSVGIDTSVLVRLLVNDPVSEAKKALNKILSLKMERTKIFVSDFVLYETYFVLKKKYAVPEKEIYSGIQKILDLGFIQSEPGSAIYSLLKSAGKKSNPGLADRIIHSHYLKFCESMITLDKEFSRLEKVSLIK